MNAQRRRFPLLAMALGAAALAPARFSPTVSRAEARETASTPYQIQFTFDGLVTFVPVDRSADGTTARELWVLSPAADSVKAIADQADSRRNDKRFRPKDGKYLAHHILMCAPAAAVTNPGDSQGRVLTVLDGGPRDIEISGLPASPAPVTLEKLDALPEVRQGSATAPACQGCLGSGLPAPLPHGATVPLGLRMVFNHGETVSVDFHRFMRWRYSKGDSAGQRLLPAAVTVTTPELTGTTHLVIRNPELAGQEMRLDIAPPTNGKTVVVRIRNAPAMEALGGEMDAGMSSAPHEAPLEHFRLGYLLAPKATTTGHPYDYDYEDYIHPVLLPPTIAPGPPPPFCRGLGAIVSSENGDPFCTSPSRMKQP